MPAHLRRLSTTRSVVIWASFILALCGWGGGLWSYLDHGFEAGVHPGFITALSVAITFTITCSHAIVMPDKVKLYGLGFRDGVQHEAARHHDPEPTRLHAVR